MEAFEEVDIKKDNDPAEEEEEKHILAKSAENGLQHADLSIKNGPGIPKIA